MLALVPLMVSLSASTLIPTHLRCESVVDPMGVDVPHPRLSWTLEANPGLKSLRQTAYEVRVATTKNLLNPHPDLWDSGKQKTSESLGVPYEGKALKSGQTVYWSVRVWDQEGVPSNWSKPATWTMSLLNPGDWKAEWIGAAPGWTPKDPAGEPVTLLLRKEFELNRAPKKALCFVCGLGQYEMRVNGKKVGNAWLTPCWTQYQKTCVADVYDLGPLLRAGHNAVGLFLGNGMYNMAGDSRGAQQPNAIGPKKAICQIMLEFADGTRQTVKSDASWKMSSGPETYCGVFGGEDYDARLEPKGWDHQGFKDQAWAAAKVMPPPGGALRGISHAAPPLAEIEVRNPVAMTHPIPNEVVLDLGQNAPYVPEVTVEGPAGYSISMWPAEILKPDGEIDQQTMRPGKYSSYKLKGGEPETWHPAFWYCGSRYWMLEAADDAGRPVEPGQILKRFRGLMVHSSAEPVGDFECSNKLLNQIYRLILWAIRSNLSHVVSDCPHREKSGWLEQLHLMGPSLLYCYDFSHFFSKIENDMADAQHPDGRIPTMAPEYFFYDDGYSDSVEWGASFLLVPSLMQSWYADSWPVKEHYPAMARYVDYLGTKTKEDILSNGLGDWNGGGADPRTPVALTDTAYYFTLIHKLAEFAKELGISADAAKYSALAERVRRRFNEAFFDPKTGKYGQGSQSAQATALDLGLVDPDQRQAAFRALLQDVEAHDYAVSCGEVGHASLLRVLAAFGRSDLVAKIHLQTDRPGYGYQVKKGLTTLAESWDASPISYNHFMLGQLMEWLYADLLGIRPDPDSPGFRHFFVSPNPVSEVNWAKGHYDSIRGRIQVSWHTTPGHFSMEVSIPPNTSATVQMLGTLVSAMSSDGTRIPIPAKKDVLELGSGIYTLLSKPSSAERAPTRGERSRRQ